MRIDIQATGSTILKRQMKKQGVEPDKSYYVQNEALVRGRRDLELGRDPPPDLVIEIQITRSALDKLGIYAAMGVPEVWLWEGDALKVYWLGENNRYVESERSRALPGLPLADLLRFVERSKENSTTRLANEFREWVEASKGGDDARRNAFLRHVRTRPGNHPQKVRGSRIKDTGMYLQPRFR